MVEISTNNYQNIVPGNESSPKGQIGSMVTLAYIVANIQNELDDYSPALYKRAMQIVIDGVREMRLYHQSCVQVAYLVVPDSGIVYYPADYIAYTKVGVPMCGQVVTLSVNPNMLLNRAQSCGQDVRQIKEQLNGGLPLALNDGYMYAPHYSNGQYIGGLYGAGGGFNMAYFREDDVMRRFEFDGVIPRIADDRIIVLEYESTGISEGTVLAAECVEPLKNWYFWKANRHRKDVSAAKVQEYKDEYHASIKKLRAYTQQINLPQLLDLLYRNFKQSPKH